MPDVKKIFRRSVSRSRHYELHIPRLKAYVRDSLSGRWIDVVKIKELMGHASIVTTMRYIHTTYQGKRGAITVLSEYRQKRRHKFVTTEFWLLSGARSAEVT